MFDHHGGKAVLDTQHRCELAVELALRLQPAQHHACACRHVRRTAPAARRRSRRLRVAQLHRRPHVVQRHDARRAAGAARRHQRPHALRRRRLRRRNVDVAGVRCVGERDGRRPRVGGGVGELQGRTRDAALFNLFVGLQTRLAVQAVCDVERHFAAAAALRTGACMPRTPPPPPSSDLDKGKVKGVRGERERRGRKTGSGRGDVIGGICFNLQHLVQHLRIERVVGSGGGGGGDPSTRQRASKINKYKKTSALAVLEGSRHEGGEGEGEGGVTISLKPQTSGFQLGGSVGVGEQVLGPGPCVAHCLRKGGRWDEGGGRREEKERERERGKEEAHESMKGGGGVGGSGAWGSHMRERDDNPTPPSLPPPLSIPSYALT